MAFNYEYPYTDPTRHNDDWLLNKMKELDAKVNDLSSRDVNKKISDQLKR